VPLYEKADLRIYLILSQAEVSKISPKHFSGNRGFFDEKLQNLWHQQRHGHKTDCVLASHTHTRQERFEWNPADSLNSLDAYSR
jgi:dTDP-4-dehydrorhamnose 3,5-epimerase-like enzyme